MTHSIEYAGLAVVGNIRVDSQERFERLRASVNSCFEIPIDWYINVRGDLREEVMAFLSSLFGERIHIFELVDESPGWMATTQKMLVSVPASYIFLWNEDHANLAPIKIYGELLADMRESKADYLPYSWWQGGRLRSIMNFLPPSRIIEHKACDVVRLDKVLWRAALAKGYPYYLVSLIGIFRREFLERLLVLDQKKWPYSYTEWVYRLMTVLNRLGISFHQRRTFAWINRILKYRLRRFPAYVPFDIEKGPDREDVLPLTVAMPRQELFCCIDDDLDLPSSQLIKRGLYPPMESMPPNIDTRGISLKDQVGCIHEDLDYRVRYHELEPGDELAGFFIEESVRTPRLSFFTYGVLRGSISLVYEQSGSTRKCEVGTWVSVPANVRHRFVTKEASTVLEVSSGRFKKDASQVIRSKVG